MTEEIAHVEKHMDEGNGYRRIILSSPLVAAGAAPGQFVHLRIPSLEESALRRPFSIFDARDGRVTLLYKTVGRGTSALASVREGDSISVLGPLGRGFPAKCSGTALLVGGGYGVAPLYFLARTLDCPKILFVGGRTAADVLAYDDFKEIGTDVRVATNDGSLGEKGFVTIPLDAEAKRLADAGERFEFFTCGPDGLLKAVADRALSFGVPGWISMDRHMICGVGACYACIQKTVRGNSRCCIEGPVFPAEDLVWQ